MKTVKSNHCVLLLKLLFLLSVFFSSFNLQADTEFTPFTGIRTSGEFREYTTGLTLDVEDSSTKGFIINYDYEPGNQLEFLYSKQSSTLRAGEAAPTNILFDVDIEYFHAGGLVLNSINENTNSFVSAGIGMTRFSSEANGHKSNSELSMNLSGGIKKRITNHIGFRLGLTLFGTATSTSTSVFCNNGSCNIHFKGRFYTQFEASAGLVFRF